MKELRVIINDILTEELVEAIISNKKLKAYKYNKIKIRPIVLEEKLLYQIASYTDTKAYHDNLSKDEAITKILEAFSHFKQGDIYTKDYNMHILISKKGKITIKKKSSTKEAIDKSHNRVKKHIIQEGNPVPFLIKLGVMTKEGKVRANKYDKFRQVNRFLEMIEDILPNLTQEKELTILDFGCGKSYLTFALYYYLSELKGLTVEIIGLDLKEDIINYCNKLALEFDYETLSFQVGDISQYERTSEVDMVVTLHACDIATDVALAKAVKWGVKVILSVPCCQHELNKQISNELLEPILEFGIIKEHIAALTTDAIRAQLLKIHGYRVQILEFIDMEHTPKNLLIRAIKQDRKEDSEELLEKYEKLKKFLSIDPALERYLDE